ncbi:MAG: oligopeptidase B, partial [Nitrospirales bacterium]|nr:oligopeptidase B [Nitrospirales bacterium]
MTTSSSHSSPLMPTPPRAKRVPHRLEHHGHVRTDEYYWLRDRENPEVLAYLQAENEYAATLRSHTRELEQTLFEEISGRIQPTDLSVPFRLGDFWYYTRYEEGKEYA